MTYLQKLKDPRWQKRRLEILQKAEFTCQGCFSGEQTLHVHHVLYRKGVEPWDYADHELKCYCEDCHKSEEFARAEFLSLFATVPGASFELLTMALRRIIDPNHSQPAMDIFEEWCKSGGLIKEKK